MVVVINEAMARRFWPDEDPIGRRIHWATGIPQFDEAPHTIVGVAADIKSVGLDKPESPAIYAPFTQRTFPWLRWNSFVVRTHGEPESFARAIRQELTKVDPLQPIYQVAPLDEWSRNRWRRGGSTPGWSICSRAALALCAVGVYGTIGYWVAERRGKSACAWRSARPGAASADGGRPRERIHRHRRRDRHRPVDGDEPPAFHAAVRRASRSTSPPSRRCRWACWRPAPRRHTCRRGAPLLDPLTVIRGE